MRASELAQLVGGTLHGPDRSFSAVAPLDAAGPHDAAFAERPPQAPCAAGVVLARAPVSGTTTVVAPDPKRAFMLLLDALFPERHPEGIQPGAHVHPTARLGTDVSVYPGAYVGPEVEVGDGTVILPNAVILAGSRVGRGCVVGPGAVVGHAGFGLHPGPDGPVPVPQVGRAVLEDGVRLGANTCVDRAFLQETRVGSGSQVDNLVQVGHNCRLGRGVVIAAQAGLSGSAVLEDGVVLAGQVGIGDHVRIGARTRVGGQAGVHRDLPPGEAWVGSPAQPLGLASRVFAAWKQLPDLIRRVRRLEQALLDRKGAGG